jgi:hypothetical protein
MKHLNNGYKINLITPFQITNLEPFPMEKGLKQIRGTLQGTERHFNPNTEYWQHNRPYSETAQTNPAHFNMFAEPGHLASQS